MSISFVSINIYFKFSTFITYVLVLIFDNLDCSKTEKIKSFNLEIIKQFYFEFLIILNAFIIYDLCKVIKKICDENKKKNKKNEIDILLLDDYEDGILNDNNENKDIKSSELPLVNKNGSINKMEIYIRIESTEMKI